MLNEIEIKKLNISEDLLNFSYYFYNENKLFDEYKDEFSKLRIAINRTYYALYRYLSIEYAEVTESKISNKHFVLSNKITDSKLLNIFNFFLQARVWADYEIIEPNDELKLRYKNMQNRAYRIITSFRNRNTI